MRANKLFKNPEKLGLAANPWGIRAPTSNPWGKLHRDSVAQRFRTSLDS